VSGERVLRGDGGDDGGDAATAASAAVVALAAFQERGGSRGRSAPCRKQRTAPPILAQAASGELN